MWTKDEMKTHQAVDDDLRLLYLALATEGMARPDWKDVSFESLACKYYHGEWCRLRMFGGLMYRRWESADGVTVWYQLIVPLGVAACCDRTSAQIDSRQSPGISKNVGVSATTFSLV